MRPKASSGLGMKDAAWPLPIKSLLIACSRPLSSRGAAIDDHRNMLRRARALDAAQQIMAAALLHVVIGDDEIRLALERDQESLHAARTVDDLDRIFLQPLRQAPQPRRIVIDEENARNGRVMREGSVFGSDRLLRRISKMSGSRSFQVSSLLWT